MTSKYPLSSEYVPPALWLSGRDRTITTAPGNGSPPSPYTYPFTTPYPAA